MKIMKVFAILLAFSMLAACGKSADEPGEPETTKSTATQELISADDIMEIAIEHAKTSGEGAVYDYLQANKATDRESEFTAKNGIPIYLCTFKIGVFEFEYEVDQQLGVIRSYSRGFTADAVNSQNGARMSEDAPLDYVLWYLDLSKDHVDNISVEYDEYMGYYILRFKADDEEYTCIANSHSGAFLRSDHDIGYSGAQEIAYNHAAQNVSALQRDDFSNLMLAGLGGDYSKKAKGNPNERTYEIGFKVGGYEYEYIIEGQTGNIVKAGCEQIADWSGDFIGGFDPNTVSLEKPELPEFFELLEEIKAPN